VEDDEQNEEDMSKLRKLETEVEEFQRINVELERRNNTLIEELSEMKKRSQ